MYVSDLANRTKRFGFIQEGLAQEGLLVAQVDEVDWAAADGVNVTYSCLCANTIYPGILDIPRIYQGEPTVPVRVLYS